MIVSAIAAVAENGVIGRDGDLPWQLPDDMKFFQRTTRGHHVITGRKNYESIPPKYRPLKDRVNIVVTRDRHYDAPGAVVAHALEEALAIAREAGETEVFVIGGGQIYKEAMAAGIIDRLYITRVHATIPGDTVFPPIDPKLWKEVRSEEHLGDERHKYPFTIIEFERI